MTLLIKMAGYGIMVVANKNNVSWCRFRLKLQTSPQAVLQKEPQSEKRNSSTIAADGDQSTHVKRSHQLLFSSCENYFL